MILSLLLALGAGALVGMQNIFNNKVNVRAGSWATTTLVLGMGFAASLAMGLIFEGKQMFDLQNIQPWYLGSGCLGVGVVVCLVQSYRRLDPTYAVSIVLTSELSFALLLDSLGWLGLEQIPFTLNKLIGVLVIVGGIFVFKLSGETKKQKIIANEARI